MTTKRILISLLVLVMAFAAIQVIAEEKAPAKTDVAKAACEKACTAEAKSAAACDKPCPTDAAAKAACAKTCATMATASAAVIEVKAAASCDKPVPHRRSGQGCLRQDLRHQGHRFRCCRRGQGSRFLRQALPH